MKICAPCSTTTHCYYHWVFITNSPYSQSQGSKQCFLSLFGLVENTANVQFLCFSLRNCGVDRLCIIKPRSFRRKTYFCLGNRIRFYGIMPTQTSAGEISVFVFTIIISIIVLKNVFSDLFTGYFQGMWNLMNSISKVILFGK